MPVAASAVVQWRHLDRAKCPAIGTSGRAAESVVAVTGANALSPARTHRQHRRVHPGAHVQLAQDVLHMNFHGGLGNVEFAR